MNFTLHPILQQDTFLVADLILSKLLLMNDTRFLWLILFPKREDILEIHELNEGDQALLFSEMMMVSKKLKEAFSADKINIASLGNKVSQLHVHIIARYKRDPAWPSPVWGVGEREFYASEKAERLLEELRKMFSENVEK